MLKSIIGNSTSITGSGLQPPHEGWLQNISIVANRMSNRYVDSVLYYTIIGLMSRVEWWKIEIRRSLHNLYSKNFPELDHAFLIRIASQCLSIFLHFIFPNLYSWTLLLVACFISERSLLILEDLQIYYCMHMHKAQMWHAWIIDIIQQHQWHFINTLYSPLRKATGLCRLIFTDLRIAQLETLFHSVYSWYDKININISPLRFHC